MLSLCGVGFRYASASAPALTDLSLDIAEGQVYGLLGPNGAGKSTLLSLLCGLLTADSGELTLDGLPLDQARRADPRAIALVPQDYAFYPTLSVRENLSFFAGALGYDGALAKARIADAVAFARLEDAVDRRAEELSGGLRRRLNLAIGLLGKPRWLLLDEPTVGVDPQSRHFLLDAIAALPAQGTSVLYTSHYMEEVQAICRRLAILDNGRLIAEGELADLCDESAPHLTLVTDAPLPEDLRQRWDLHGLGRTEYSGHLASAALLPKLIEEVTAHVGIRRLASGQPDLEQLFMRLTRRSLRD